MNNTKKGVLLLIIASIFSSCGADLFNRIEGNRNVITEKRKISDSFNGVKVSSGIDLYIKQGNQTELSVEADENLHDYIITEVNGDQLHIYVDGNIWRAKAKKVYLTLTELKELKASSGSSVYSKGVIKTDDIEVSTSSGADVEIEIDAKNITSSSSSGSGLRMSGTCETHTASASSGSSISTYELVSAETTAKVSSGADIRVFASSSIDARASSGGVIRYKGNPKKIITKTSSGGGISKKE